MKAIEKFVLCLCILALLFIDIMNEERITELQNKIIAIELKLNNIK